MNEFTNGLVMLSHAVFGVFANLALVWLYAEALNASKNNLKRVKLATYHVVVWITLTFVVGGFWYIGYYGYDKGILLKSGLANIHKFFTETKEHIFFIVLILSYYLPFITLRHDLSQNEQAKKAALVLTMVVGLLVFYVEGAGAIIAQGVKAALMLGVR